MNDLIINGIDHSVFDLEWAKRGGWLRPHEFLDPVKLLSYHEYHVFGYGFASHETYGENESVFRMATPSECAKAGVEYIEPPARWLPIKDFPQPEYIWLGSQQDKPSELSVDDWEDYEIRENRAIICTENGLVTEAYEWFGEWYYLVNDFGDCYAVKITPTRYMPLPPKDE